MTEQFRITKLGAYRSRNGEKAVVLGKNPNNRAYPWVGFLGEDVMTWMDDGSDYSTGIQSIIDLVAEWVDDPKTRRYSFTTHKYGLRRCCETTLAPIQDVVSLTGFRHYIYDIDGIEGISSLPCGWPVATEYDKETSEPTAYEIASTPPNPGDKPVFPVAWLREIKGEGGE